MSLRISRICPRRTQVWCNCIPGEHPPTHVEHSLNVVTTLYLPVGDRSTILFVMESISHRMLVASAHYDSMVHTIQKALSIPVLCK
jgi:hypothetical protein